MFMYELVVKFKSCYYVAISIQINFSEFCKAFGLYLNLSEQTNSFKVWGAYFIDNSLEFCLSLVK